LLVILLGTLLNACFTFWYVRRNNQKTAEILSEKGNDLFETVQNQLDEALGEFRPLISRAMSIVGTAGAQVKQVQAFEREVVRSIQDELPITPEMIGAFSPRLAEMVENNPELLIRGQQILQKMLGDVAQNDPYGSSMGPVDRRPEI